MLFNGILSATDAAQRKQAVQAFMAEVQLHSSPPTGSQSSCRRMALAMNETDQDGPLALTYWRVPEAGEDTMLTNSFVTALVQDQEDRSESGRGSPMSFLNTPGTGTRLRRF